MADPVTPLDEEIFEAARACHDDAERRDCLDSLCGKDVHLRERIEALLRVQDEAECFFGKDPVMLAQGTSPHNSIERAGTLDELQGLRIGPYVLREKLGEGGCGVVFVAEQETPVRRQVAVKLIKPGMDSRSVVARFTAERQALARMDHPHVAHIYDAGTTDTGRLYFVMELIRGSRITTYCDQARLSTRQRIELFINVCHAVQHAHQKGIIHRDLKPSNVLVAVKNGAPVPKVIDFGIAKAIEGRLTELTLQTELNHFLGTPAYMSPEQADSRAVDVDTRSDVYSLGVLLYELLTGVTPFDTSTLLQGGIEGIRRTIREAEPLRPSTRLGALSPADRENAAAFRGLDSARLRQELSGDLDWIVVKCLEKDPGRRYQTANGLAMDLQRHLNYEPVVARPPGQIYKIRKFARRNRLVFAAGVTVALALLVGIVVSTYQAIRAQRAEGLQARLLEEAGQARRKAEIAEADAKAREADSRRLLYIANMRLAQQLWEAGDLPRLRQVLSETRSDAHRGFEWHFLMQMTHLETRSLRSSAEQVTATAVSSGGRWGAFGSRAGEVELCDLVAGKRLWTWQGPAVPVMALAFSPDEQRLLILNEAGNALLRDLGGKSADIPFKTLKSPRVGAFSPVGDLVVAGEAEGTVEVFRAADGSRLHELSGHTDWVFGVAFSPDGRQLATASWDRTIRLWDARTGEPQSTLVGHEAGVLAVAYSPDGRQLASGGFDSSVRLWELPSGLSGAVLRGHSDLIRVLQFLPGGSRIVSAGADRTLRIWDTSTGATLNLIRGHSGEIDSLNFVSGAAQEMTTGCHDGTIKLWSISQAVEVPMFGKAPTGSGYADWQTSMAAAPDGRRVVISKQSLPPEVWDVDQRRPITTFVGHEPAFVSSVAFSPDGERVVTGSHDKTAKIWDSSTGREWMTLRGHRHFVSSVAWSADGAYVVTGSLDREARIWDARTGRELTTLRGHAGAIHSVAVSSSSRMVATAGEDGTVCLWDRESGRVERSLSGKGAWFLSVAISPDGSRVLAGSVDGTATLWDTRTGAEVFRVVTPFSKVGSVGFSPDGSRFLAAGDGKSAQLHDAVTGRVLLVLRGDRSLISGVTFLADGLRIGAIARDGTFRTWRGVPTEIADAWSQTEAQRE